MIYRIVFWEPSVSPHKADLFEAIKVERPHVNFLHVAQAGVAPERSAMGWEVHSPVGYDEIISPSAAQCREIAFALPKETFHVFSGMRHIPCIVEGLRAVRAVGARFAIMSEPRVNEGPQGVLRYLQSWLTEGFLRRHATCVFAIGLNGPPWFKSVGYQQQKVFPFAYFINQISVSTETLPIVASPLRVGYLGRIVRAKGVFSLLEAISTFTDHEVTLKLAGPMGDEVRAVTAAIESCPCHVTLLGSMPMSEVATFLHGLDILVLPSVNKDGWGVVVTEALMMGIPVVATTCVGASLVLKDIRLGAAVAPNAPHELATAIRDISKSENLSDLARTWRKDWAKKHLSAQVGARYFWNVLDHRLNATARPATFYE